MDRVWKTALAAAMITACLAAMAGSALAKGMAGARDASFGKDGKVKKVLVGSGNEAKIKQAVEAALGE